MKKIINTIEKYAKHKHRARKAGKEARACLKDIGGGYTEYDEQYEKIVVPYWQKFGIKPKKMWYRLFEQKNDVVDPRYIPDDIWFADILPKFCRIDFLVPYEDKCMYHLHFPKLKKPVTVVKRINGIFYDDQLNLLSFDEVKKRCVGRNDLIMKPSIGSGKGRKIKVYTEKPIRDTELCNDIKKMGENFIIQEIVRQHEILDKIHSKSLNTIRVLSMFYKGDVYILSVILRMGVGTSQIDNVSAGGLQCGVNADGSLHPVAYNLKREKYIKHPDGVIFKEITIPAFDKVICAVKEEHRKLPYFQIIGWDFAVDRNTEPVFIEFNICPWQNQLTCGPTFGDMTDDVLEYVFGK